MNTIIRGVRNAFRNVVRTGSIVVILSISIGLVIAMLAARQAVDTKIEDLKSSVGNTISISPAGFRGFEGGGSALTTEQLEKVKELAHVTGVTSSLSDRLSTDDTTNLESAIELGSLGGRLHRLRPRAQRQLLRPKVVKIPTLSSPQCLAAIQCHQLLLRAWIM